MVDHKTTKFISLPIFQLYGKYCIDHHVCYDRSSVYIITLEFLVACMGLEVLDKCMHVKVKDICYLWQDAYYKHDNETY